MERGGDVRRRPLLGGGVEAGVERVIGHRRTGQATGVGTTTSGCAEVVDRLITPRRCIVRLEHVITADGRTTYFHISRLVLLPLGEKRLEPHIPVDAERRRDQPGGGDAAARRADCQEKTTMFHHRSPPMLIAFACNSPNLERVPP